MERSCFFAHEAISRRVAVGHITGGGAATVARPWAMARSAHPFGGIVSTVTDLLKYARFQLGDGTALDGTRLLSPESLAEMQTPHTPGGSSSGALGVAWQIKMIEGVRTVRHGGGTNGQSAILLLAPERGFAITVLTNGSMPVDVTWPLKHYLGIEERLSEALPLDESALSACVGRFDTPLNAYELSVRDGELWMQATPKGGFPDKDSKPLGPVPPPVRLAVCAEDMIVALDQPFKHARGEFVRNTNGVIGWLRFGGRIAPRVN